MLALKFTDRIAARRLPPMISSKSGLLVPASRLATGDEDVMYPPPVGINELLETICTVSALLPRKRLGTETSTFERVGEEHAARSIAFMDNRASSLWCKTAPVSERTREIMAGSMASLPLALSGRLLRRRCCMRALRACRRAVRGDNTSCLGCQIKTSVAECCTSSACLWRPSKTHL